MVAIWTEDTLVQPGKPVTRGFGGRIYFYNEKSQAIPVEGELIVYGYDDSSAAAAHSLTSAVEANKKFVFTPEQFTQHFSQSDLGASYSIWIPWDVAGGPQKKIALMPTFITQEQRMVRGEASKLTLSGKPTATLVQGDVPNNTIQLASASMPAIEPGALMNLSAPNGQTANAPNGNPNSTLAAPFNGDASNPSSMKTTTIRLNQPIQNGAAAARPGMNSGTTVYDATSQSPNGNWISATPTLGANINPQSQAAAALNSLLMMNQQAGGLGGNPNLNMAQTNMTQPSSPAGVNNVALASATMAGNTNLNNHAGYQVPSTLPGAPTQAAYNQDIKSFTGGLAETLPPLGHHVPPTGWVQPARLQSVAPQLPAGQAAGR